MRFMTKSKAKLVLFSFGIWVFLLAGRLWWNGGFDRNFRSESDETLRPIQQAMSRQIETFMDGSQAILLQGMLLGVQQNVPRDLKLKLQATSTIHMIVVSGSNLSLIAAFLIGVLGFLGRKTSTVLTLGAILFYSLLTGMGVPVVRAALMSGLTLGGQLLGRNTTGWWILLISGGGMVLWEPNWLLSISFQLSFLATFGVVVVAPLVERYMSRLPELFRQDFAVSLAAQLTTMPIVAINFNQLSVVGVVINCLLLWVVSPVMIVGAGALGLSWLWLPAAQGVAWVPYILLTYFLDVVELGSRVPYGSLELGESSLVFWLGYYILLGGWIVVHLNYDKTTDKSSIETGRCRDGI